MRQITGVVFTYLIFKYFRWLMWGRHKPDYRDSWTLEDWFRYYANGGK